MKQYIAYMRVSTKEQGDSKLGLEAQEKSVNDFAAREGGIIISQYRETESGRKDQRPALLKAIDESKRTGAQLLIAKLDRLSRNAKFIFLLRDTHVDFVCADMPSANSVTIGIMAVLAQDEAERTSQRTRDALAALKARGVVLGNPNIASFAKKGNQVMNANRTVQQTANSEVLGLILIKRSEGKIFAKIAKELNEANFRTTYGKEFTADNVRIIFSQAKAKMIAA